MTKRCSECCLTSPFVGELAAKRRVRGFEVIERPYPLTPTLSPWERERAVHAATACIFNGAS